jgi:N-acetylglutamate synthase-like GNAT family acetyltransferase
LESNNSKNEQRRIAALYRLLTLGNRTKFPSPIELCADASEESLSAQVWSVLRTSPLFIGVWPANAEKSLLMCARQIAIRLKVYKLVLLDSEGGIYTGGSLMSFMNGPVLSELLRQGEAEWAGLGDRRALLEMIYATLKGGVTSASLCAVAGLARELFTYEGLGTFFTLTDYCRVERLSIDDFHEVEKLLERGEHEGYLKARSPAEIDQLLLHGYGALLGAAPGEFAGFCALLPYPEDNAAEIVGLYTITRFQGEGIGSSLVSTMITEGEASGFTYLFATTMQEGAQRLFERYGFRRVAPDDVAATKWHGYNAERRKQVAVYRRELQAPRREVKL